MWDSRGGPVAQIHVTLTFTHHRSTHPCPVTGVSISVMRNNHVTGIQEYPCSNNPCNMNNGPCNRNTETINTYIPVTLCNNGIRT